MLGVHHHGLIDCLCIAPTLKLCTESIDVVLPGFNVFLALWMLVGSLSVCGVFVVSSR